MKLLLLTTLIFGFSSLALAGDKANDPNRTVEDAEIIFCTMDAKACPDGSYVSRQGPDCEFAPCPSEKPEYGDEKLIDVTITGSAETPDPVSERVRELEKKGTVSNVVIMESFPVQIRMLAPQHIIDELEAMPRVKLPTFK